MTLKQLLTTHYGVGTHRRVSKFTRQKAKLAATKNHAIFLERCLFYLFIPTFLQSSPPVKSPRARRITKKYQVSLLRETLYLERTKWHQISNRLKRTDGTLKQTLSEEHYGTIARIAHTSYENAFQKHKKHLKEKFEKLQKKQGKTKKNNTRLSLIKNPILQLQKDDPLPPEAVDLLSLGPKFSVTPKNIPTMEIITEVEKCCLTLERKGKLTEAQVLRHQATNILKNPKKPKSNLTASQRKGLSYLKNRKDLAITPFDKGQGFVSIEKEKLVEKAEKEFQNVSLDTPDTTGSLERKIQTKLRQLKKDKKNR